MTGQRGPLPPPGYHMPRGFTYPLLVVPIKHFVFTPTNIGCSGRSKTFSPWLKIAQLFILLVCGCFSTQVEAFVGAVTDIPMIQQSSLPLSSFRNPLPSGPLTTITTTTTTRWIRGGLSHLKRDEGVIQHSSSSSGTGTPTVPTDSKALALRGTTTTTTTTVPDINSLITSFHILASTSSSSSSSTTSTTRASSSSAADSTGSSESGNLLLKIRLQREEASEELDQLHLENPQPLLSQALQLDSEEEEDSDPFSLQYPYYYNLPHTLYSAETADSDESKTLKLSREGNLSKNFYLETWPRIIQRESEISNSATEIVKFIPLREGGGGGGREGGGGEGGEGGIVEDTGSNIWTIEGSEKSRGVKAEEESLWPYLPGSHSSGHDNKEEIRANLDSEETRGETAGNYRGRSRPVSDVELDRHHRHYYHHPEEHDGRPLISSISRNIHALSKSSQHQTGFISTIWKKNEAPHAFSSAPLAAPRGPIHYSRLKKPSHPEGGKIRGLPQELDSSEKEGKYFPNDLRGSDERVVDLNNPTIATVNVNRKGKYQKGKNKYYEEEKKYLESRIGEYHRQSGLYRETAEDSSDGHLQANRTLGRDKQHTGHHFAREVVANTVLFRRKRKIEMREVTVVEGGLAALPCDLDVSDPSDSVQLILWIKEGIHTPLYSYDYRELLGGRPKETKPDANSTLARRTTFRTDSSPAALIVERVEAEDGGIYRCRVDFLLSPTRNKRVNLTVIVPPSRARVSWQLGNSGVMGVEGPVVGPFLEDAQPSLICHNDDGWPPPSVTWYEGDVLLDDTYSIDSVRATVENDLSLGPLTRGDLGRRLTCLASNTNKTQPATTTVTIAMTLSIVGVRVEEVASVWAAEKAKVRCRVWGSRPPPTVVWWLGSTMLAPSETKVMEEGNLTVSVLHFTPRPQDDGAMLICQATNEKLPDQAVQDSRLLSVSYAPLVDVQLGRSLDPFRIKEGDDVYFECSVKSKPPISKVAWKHNDVKLEAGNGVFVSNMSLVVQSVTRAHAGNYTCEATNIKATSSSPPLNLDVKYAPVCATQRKVQHSVAKLENAEISCKVHANPANVTFKWTFNNTAEAIDVPDGRFVVSGTESRVNYTPMNELDYGTLLCWANNTIGIQERPCVFHIVAAGKPDPPHNCRVFDVTISSLQVTCLAGDDGGLIQNFLLQVYQIGSTSPVVEVTRSSPSFSVANLRPATAYKIILAAINDKGASTVRELKAYTVRVPETQEETSAEPTRDRERGTAVPWAVVVGGVLAGVPVVVVVVILVWLRVCRRSAAAASAAAAAASDGRRSSTHSKDGASTDLASDTSQPDERNPDLISHTPDPSEFTEKRAGDISTISTTSTFFLPNGGPSYCSTSTTTPASIGGLEYTQLICTDHGQTQTQTHPHTHAHTHLHTHTPPAAVCQVPYSPDAQQQQQQKHQQQQQQQQQQQEELVDLPLPPPPASYNQGYQVTANQDCQPSPVPCYSTLERKRHQQSYQPVEDYQGTCQQGYQPTEGYQPEVIQYQTPFPHLYQLPSGGFSPTPHGSQYSLAGYQGSHTQVPLPVGSPPPSLQGTLRRGSKKKHAVSGGGGEHHQVTPSGPASSPSPQPPPTSTAQHHHHHHHCEVHDAKPPLGPPGDMGTLKRTRRAPVAESVGKEDSRGEIRGGGESRGGMDRDNVELTGERLSSSASSSSVLTPTSARKSKRESAV